MSERIEFVKGHGTENDFVVVPDVDAELGRRLDAAAVRRLTDRHAGIGADGVIRVVPAAAVDEVAENDGWFMDYRNADGSVAEMCGNGVRVMAAFLRDQDLVGEEFTVVTRGGARAVRAEPDGQFTVEMGRARVPERILGVIPEGDPEGGQGETRGQAGAVEGSADVMVALGGRTWPARAVLIPNPHAVVFLDDGVSSAESGIAEPGAVHRGAGTAGSGLSWPAALTELGPLAGVPTFEPESAFPAGANVEYVVTCGNGHIALRVWERGVGETRSCGTGVCAAAWAAMRRDGAGPATYVVDVPGGRLRVTEASDGEITLSGPAVLGLRGDVRL